MEIIKNIAVVFFIIALLVTWSVNPPASFSFAGSDASGASKTSTADSVPNADGYTLPDYVNQDYGEVGYEYYMDDSKKLPIDDLSNAGHSYYASDYGRYAQYNDVDTGYEYFVDDSKNFPLEDISSTGQSYYASDYSKYAEYNDIDTGYEYYKKSKKYQDEYDSNEGYRLYREFDEYGYDGDL